MTPIVLGHDPIEITIVLAPGAPVLCIHRATGRAAWWWGGWSMRAPRGDA